MQSSMTISILWRLFLSRFAKKLRQKTSSVRQETYNRGVNICLAAHAFGAKGQTPSCAHNFSVSMSNDDLK